MIFGSLGEEMRNVVGALAGLVLFASSASASNLIVNGSFEGAPVSNSVLAGGSSAISGWTTTNQGVEWFTPASFGSVAQDGSAVVDLAWFTSNGNPGGGIAQTIATVIGQNYQLSFYGATQTGSGRDGTAIIELSVAGGPLNSFNVENLASSISQGDWPQFFFDFTATSDFTTIEFRNRQNASLHFANIDNVSVESIVTGAVPEPATWLMMILGLGIFAAFQRNRSRI